MLILLVGAAMACGGDEAGSSASNTLHMEYVATMVGCGSPAAVGDPDVPGRCIKLGDSLFGPSDFTKPVVKDDPALGPGVGITLTDRARDIFVNYLKTVAPSAPTDPGVRLTFVFDGQPLSWSLLPGPDANLFVATPNTTLAQGIVASLHGS